MIVELRLCFPGALLLDEGKPGLGTEVRGSKLIPGVLRGHLFGLAHMFPSPLETGVGCSCIDR